MLRFLAAVFKIALASLLAGAGLSLFNISSAQILEQIGMTPEAVWGYVLRATNWAVPNMLLGSMIVLPLWFLTYVFIPPRERERD
ncbi:DUF6460 domain-containing protein [Rhizobium sp. 32-5/1]|uniref:DUF6460 domain-containing protein n=1 Tax=Rhizobium sp. 32-5/1 TaxID=3019602 RepID=UPI00240DEFF0|nr:DUF6460 domain-containing protein [Rhizobium sp. 32-5/1]WEZ84356.1 DUF6460 domain-containing protein [Rhizobium sp. 32-5/1]